MRIDKYLKVSRLIKRRTIASEACSAGRITINGKVANPSSQVNPGDLISIRFGEHTGLYKRFYDRVYEEVSFHKEVETDLVIFIRFYISYFVQK